MFPTGLFALYYMYRTVRRSCIRNCNKEQENTEVRVCKQLQQRHYKPVAGRRSLFAVEKRQQEYNVTLVQHRTQHPTLRKGYWYHFHPKKHPVTVARRSIDQESDPTHSSCSIASRQDSMMFSMGLLALYYTYRTLRRSLIQNHNKEHANTEGRMYNQLQQHHCNGCRRETTRSFRGEITCEFYYFLSFWDLKIP
jgi:hypothetical protein